MGTALRKLVKEATIEAKTKTGVLWQKKNLWQGETDGGCDTEADRILWAGNLKECRQNC